MGRVESYNEQIVNSFVVEQEQSRKGHEPKYFSLLRSSFGVFSSEQTLLE